MATTTTPNYSLVTEDEDEPVLLHRLRANGNMEAIDSALAAKLDASRYRGRQTWGDLVGRDTWGSIAGADATPSGTDSSTTELSLTKPGYDSTVDVATLNDDLDAIDAAFSADRGRLDAAESGISGLALEQAYDRRQANNYYGGRSLVTILAGEIESAGNVYAALHARAQTANFEGLRVGDWMDVPLTAKSGTITQGTVRYVIAAFDHYHNCSDQPIGHHVVFVPHAPVDMTGSSYATNTRYIMWNTTATNQGSSSQANPYLNSNLHKWELNEYLGKLPTTLQGYLLNHRSLVESRYSASGSLTASTGWAWADLGKVWSPSEMEVYGCAVWGTMPWSQGMDSQLPLFRETRDRIMGGRVTWWLRSAASGSSSDACKVSGYGDAGSASAADTWRRPRPCFLVG